jgi:hypothetical protein
MNSSAFPFQVPSTNTPCSFTLHVYNLINVFCVQIDTEKTADLRIAEQFFLRSECFKEAAMPSASKADGLGQRSATTDELC